MIKNLTAIRLYRGSLGIRRVTWLAAGALALWRFGSLEADGFSACCRSFWQTETFLDFAWISYVLSKPERYWEDVLEHVWYATWETLSVALAVVVILQVITWIAAGFGKDIVEGGARHD
jgi:hypothetical protein